MFVNVRALLLGSLTVSVAIAACAANGNGGSTGSGSTFASTGGGGNGAGAGTTGSGLNGSGAGNGAGTSTGKFTTTNSTSGVGGISPDAACASVKQKANGAPVDLYILLDKSTSMAGDKWDGATAGLNDFVTDMSSAGLSVALNFLPIDASRGMPGTCDPNQYKDPVVAFGVLPGNASAINHAMSAGSPDGMSSPIYPALGGALTGALNQVQANPGHAGAVLLVTDGAPDGPASCSGVNPDSSAAVAGLAANGLMFNPPINTFVVGLEGVDANIADSIAAAGGTTKAIIIGSGNVAMDFKNALAQVRGQTLPCSFDIPQKVANGDIDPNDVNVLYTPSGGAEAIVPQNAQCSGEGWHYDDPMNPTKIIFCPKSCDDVHSDYGAQVEILLGCATVVK